MGNTCTCEAPRPVVWRKRKDGTFVCSHKNQRMSITHKNDQQQLHRDANDVHLPLTNPLQTQQQEQQPQREQTTPEQYLAPLVTFMGSGDRANGSAHEVEAFVVAPAFAHLKRSGHSQTRRESNDDDGDAFGLSSHDVSVPTQPSRISSHGSRISSQAPSRISSHGLPPPDDDLHDAELQRFADDDKMASAPISRKLTASFHLEGTSPKDHVEQQQGVDGDDDITHLPRSALIEFTFPQYECVMCVYVCVWS